MPGAPLELHIDDDVLRACPARCVAQAAFRPLRALIVSWRTQKEFQRLHPLGRLLRMKDWFRIRLLKKMAVLGSPSSAHDVSGSPIPWMAVPYSPSSALQPVLGAVLPPYPVVHRGVVVREFTREQHLEYGDGSVDTVRYLRIGMWVLLDPERAPEGVDDAGWFWARVRSPWVLGLALGWVHPQIFLQ